jgi:hypothetical protein
MRYVYWSREIAGWLVVSIGLWQFWNTYVLLTNRRIFEAAPSAFIAFVIFRGGIHLLKVAVAAQAARVLPDSAGPGGARRAGRMPVKSFDPTPLKAVVPGPRGRAGADANGEAD